MPAGRPELFFKPLRGHFMRTGCLAISLLN